MPTAKMQCLKIARTAICQRESSDSYMNGVEYSIYVGKTRIVTCNSPKQAWQMALGRLQQAIADDALEFFLESGIDTRFVKVEGSKQ